MGPGTFGRFITDNHSRIDGLVKKYADYRPASVSETRIRKWLTQFQPREWHLAVKLAEKIQYYDNHKIHGLMKSLHNTIKAQIKASRLSFDQALFVPLGPVGESGHSIVSLYRNVNRLKSSQSQFITWHELPSKTHNMDSPIIFFLDDFIGSGTKVADYWKSTLSQLVHESFPLYVAVLAACKEGIKKIKNESPIIPVSAHSIRRSCYLFDSANRNFTSSEKTIIRRHCERIKNLPFGYGDLGLMISFVQGTPNNSIAIIRGSKGQKPWSGLLPGYNDL